MLTFVADELLPMYSKFPTKLACIIAAICAAPVFGQDSPLKPVEETVEDISQLSTSFRYVEPGVLTVLLMRYFPGQPMYQPAMVKDQQFRPAPCFISGTSFYKAP